ncbi:MAB_1171c family putative transporter [Streptomyces sp. NPDC088915]|uniref:MAB_1171c family putative transporter n=1 Tax=Streptomyces sp. NPDC088915 TaxID=3365912 RepID=UPI0037FE5012
MKDLLHPLCLIIAGTGFLILLRDLLRDRRGTSRSASDPALVALAVSFLASALSFAVSITWVWVRVDGFFGVPNIVVPLAQSLVILVLALQSTVLAYWSRPAEQARRRAKHLLITAAVVIAGMAVLFTLLTPATQRPVDFSLYYAHDPYYQGYVLLYFGTYSVAEIYLARSCWKYARTAGAPSIAAGLRLVTIGATITLAYSSIRIAAIIGAEVGFSVSHLNGFAWACGDIGATLTQIGYFLPVLAARTGSLYTLAREHFVYARLDNLWTTLVRTDPGIVLQQPVPQREYLRQRKGLGYELIRRRAEIRDAQITLRPYLSEAARRDIEARRARPWRRGRRLAAAVTADQLQHALVLHTQGKPVAEPTEYADSALVLDTVRAEEQHLLRVAAYFHAPPRSSSDSPVSTTPSGART